MRGAYLMWLIIEKTLFLAFELATLKQKIVSGNWGAYVT